MNEYQFPRTDPFSPVSSLDAPYLFVHNSPLDWIDADGLYTWQEWQQILNAAGDGAGQGAQACLDGMNPFGSPFGNNGGYNTNDPILKVSGTLGAVGGGLLDAAGSLGAAGAAGGTRACRILNHNRYCRFGPGRWGGKMVPRISIGNGPPSWWNHWRL